MEPGHDDYDSEFAKGIEVDTVRRSSAVNILKSSKAEMTTSREIATIHGTYLLHKNSF